MWFELVKSVDIDIGLWMCGVVYLVDSENDMVGFWNWLVSVVDFGLLLCLFLVF